jgi:hypothetical protein
MDMTQSRSQCHPADERTFQKFSPCKLITHSQMPPIPFM